MSESRSVGDRQQARLKSVARRNGWDVEAVMVRYALERLLYRLQVAGYSDALELKGALSVIRWTGGLFHRATQDMDINGRLQGNDPQQQLKHIAKAVYQACRQDVDDGLTFDTSTLNVHVPRNADPALVGGRIDLKAFLGSTRIPIRVDVSFDHPVTPPASPAALSTVTDDMPQPEFHLYPLETTIAEKVSAALNFGQFNTRVRDYYDIWYISRCSDQTFDGETMVEALRRTFDHQGVTVPDEGVPVAFTDEYARQHRKTWEKVARTKKIDAPDLETVMSEVRTFVIPLLEAVRGDAPTPGNWDAENGWVPVPAPACSA